jgi:Tol biopolymer transport system component
MGNNNNYPGAKFVSLSADAGIVAFTSNATDLVAGASSGKNQVYVRDRRAGTTDRISVGPDGVPLGAAEVRYGQNVSADGRYVVFTGWRQSPSPPVGRAPTPAELAQVYLYDRTTGVTTLVSHGRTGPGDADSYFPAIAADGSHVAFISEANDLVASDHNGDACARSGYDTCGVDFFSYDVATGRLARVSVTSNGTEQNFVGDLASANLSVTISRNGRFVAFPSLATNLGPDAGNGKSQVYVHDLSTGSTTRASVSSTGAAANDDAIFPVLAPDGSFATFVSAATHLAADRNGFSDVFLHVLSP